MILLMIDSVFMSWKARISVMYDCISSLRWNPSRTPMMVPSCGIGLMLSGDMLSEMSSKIRRGTFFIL